jgi:hypothetical protein
MKTKIVLYIFSFLAGFIGFHVWAKETVGPNDHYVVLKVAETGNTIGLSDKFSSYDSCINSADYRLHTLVSNESKANIQCINAVPTYK